MLVTLKSIEIKVLTSFVNDSSIKYRLTPMDDTIAIVLLVLY